MEGKCLCVGFKGWFSEGSVGHFRVGSNNFLVEPDIWDVCTLYIWISACNLYIQPWLGVVVHLSGTRPCGLVSVIPSSSLWWPEVEVWVQGPAKGHVLRVCLRHHDDLALCPGPDDGTLPAFRKSV